LRPDGRERITQQAKIELVQLLAGYSSEGIA
jgi:hypothetical protein